MNWFYGMSEALRALAGMDKMEFYTLLSVIIVSSLIWLARHIYASWTNYKIAKEQQDTLKILSMIDAAKTLGVVGALMWAVSRLK